MMSEVHLLNDLLAAARPVIAAAVEWLPSGSAPRAYVERAPIEVFVSLDIPAVARVGVRSQPSGRLDELHREPLGQALGDAVAQFVEHGFRTLQDGFAIAQGIATSGQVLAVSLTVGVVDARAHAMIAASGADDNGEVLFSVASTHDRYDRVH